MADEKRDVREKRLWWIDGDNNVTEAVPKVKNVSDQDVKEVSKNQTASAL